jgi:hypothetical protein
MEKNLKNHKVITQLGTFIQILLVEAAPAEWVHPFHQVLPYQVHPFHQLSSMPKIVPITPAAFVLLIFLQSDTPL